MVALGNKSPKHTAPECENRTSCVLTKNQSQGKKLRVASQAMHLCLFANINSRN